MNFPDFLIIGTQKGGTTSLYQYLLAHPHIAPAASKEVHFFDLQFDQGADWYRSQFPPPVPAGQPLTGEATPYYLFHPLVPQRVAAFCPQVKLIVLLRNPVDRALSHYHHEVRWGFEDLPLAEAIAAEDDRLAGEAEKFAADPLYASYAYQHYSYRARGRYREQLVQWRSHFSASQILILSSHKLNQDTAATLDRVAEFLALPPLEWANQTNLSQKFNAGDYSAAARVARPAEPPRATHEDHHRLRQQLAAEFAPHNRALREYLAAEFPQDLSGEFAGETWLH